jgi:phosphomethylpyrimidine synthase
MKKPVQVNKDLLHRISVAEDIEPLLLQEKIATGRIVIPANRLKKISRPCAIGEGLRTKINANIGSSRDSNGLKEELRKLEVCIQYGADTVMDLSTGKNLKSIRNAIIEHSSIPVGTVPIYEAAINASRQKGNLSAMEVKDILDTIEEQAREGVDFFTIHCGLNKRTLEIFSRNERVLDIVSRGGAMLVEWMAYNRKENPLYEYFDDILEIAHDYNIVLSLGDCFRPGSVVDATDRPQIEELVLLGELSQRARSKGVQIIIEGPGHLPLSHIEANVLLEKKLCQGAPFYVLGPLVSDIAAGYDHISGAIGAAYAAYYGADFLCYVTPAEHLRLPTIEDVKEGVIAFKIAAQAADLARGRKDAIEKDRQFSLARKRRDWEKQIKLSIDPQKARLYRTSKKLSTEDVCSMCSEYCSIKLVDKYLKLLHK